MGGDYDHIKGGTARSVTCGDSSPGGRAKGGRVQRSCLASPPGRGGRAQRGRSGRAEAMTTPKAEQPAQSPSVTALPGGRAKGTGAAKLPCLSPWERWPSAARTERADGDYDHIKGGTARSVTFGDGSPRGRAKRRKRTAWGTLRRTYRPSHGGRAGPPWGRGWNCIRHVMCRVYQRLPGLSRGKFTKRELFFAPLQPPSEGPPGPRSLPGRSRMNIRPRPGTRTGPVRPRRALTSAALHWTELSFPALSCTLLPYPGITNFFERFLNFSTTFPLCPQLYPQPVPSVIHTLHRLCAVRTDSPPGCTPFSGIAPNFSVDSFSLL